MGGFEPFHSQDSIVNSPPLSATHLLLNWLREIGVRSRQIPLHDNYKFEFAGLDNVRTSEGEGTCSSLLSVKEEEFVVNNLHVDVACAGHGK